VFESILRDLRAREGRGQTREFAAAGVSVAFQGLRRAFFDLRQRGLFDRRQPPGVRAPILLRRRLHRGGTGPGRQPTSAGRSCASFSPDDSTIGSRSATAIGGGFDRRRLTRWWRCVAGRRTDRSAR